MLGIDLTNITRFTSPSKALVKKILHLDELLEYNASQDKPKFLAARWAIKEALYKADNKLSAFNKINIRKVDRKYIFNDYQISTSTEGNYYIAIVKRNFHESKN